MFGLFTGSTTDIDNLDTASDWVNNVDREIKEIVGSEESDGLVAKESQYYPMSFSNPETKEITEIHSNVLGDKKVGFVAMPNHNHYNISPIVGTGDETDDSYYRINQILRDLP